jgi:preprotein translocase subunit SecG
MITIFLAIHFIIAALLVGIILIQRTGDGALSGLGGGAMGGVMSVRGAANLLTRMTAIFAVLFMISSLVLGIYYRSSEKQRSILEAPVETSEELFMDEDEQPVTSPLDHAEPKATPAATPAPQEANQ